MYQVRVPNDRPLPCHAQRSMLKVEGQLDITAGDHMLTDEEARMYGMIPFEHCLLQVRRIWLLRVVQTRRTWRVRGPIGRPTPTSPRSLHGCT